MTTLDSRLSSSQCQWYMSYDNYVVWHMHCKLFLPNLIKFWYVTVIKPINSYHISILLFLIIMIKGVIPGQKAWGIYVFHFCAKKINSKLYCKLSWKKGSYILMVMRVTFGILSAKPCQLFLLVEWNPDQI